MAKLYSAFSTSPQDSIFSEYWSYHHLPNESYDANILVKNEPELPELFEDLHCPYSITNDILRLTEENGFGTGGGSESDGGGDVDGDGGDGGGGDFNSSNSFDNESKVRNKNLMWSGTTAPLSTSASSSVSDNGALVPLSFVTGCFSSSPVANQHQKQQDQQINNKPPPTVVIASNKSRINGGNKANQQQQQNFSVFTTIKTEPFDDYEQQLQQHNILNSKTSSSTTTSKIEHENMQNIPPGTSLLRKSNIQQQQRKQQIKLTSISIPKIYPSEFVRERDQLLTTTTLNPSVSSRSNRNTNNNSSIGVYGRPDTPHSLDDESALLYNNDNDENGNDNENENENENDNDNDCNNLTGFIHQVDLRACIMGSNNISLTATDPTPLINHLSQQLQDTSKDQIDLPFMSANNNRSLAEVLDYINNKNDIIGDDCCDMVDGVGGSGGSSSCHATEKITNSMHNLHTSGYDSDEESLNDACSISSSLMNDEDSLCTKIDECNSPANSLISHSSNSSSTNSNCNSSSSSPQYHMYSRSSNMQQQQQQQQKQQPAQQQQQHQKQQQQQQQSSYLHSDHSYTRCKDGIDDLGNLDHLDTPSDSDEEIDVVSIGDKKLPTNPSDRDRRALQTKVACKFANPRSVKTVNGVRTIPPRSRGTFELPYTPVSSSPVKSVANSRYPSPASTPYHNQQYTSTASSSLSTPIIIMNGNGNCEKSRKRININGIIGVNNDAVNTIDYALPPFKKCRGKKQQQQQQALVNNNINNNSSSSSSSSCNNSTFKRHYSMDDPNDTVEKRNLHNDMERQRRIGLKNLFDVLKKQIPSIKDKERAPKVNILREAAKLCEALTREDEQLNEQRAMLKEQLRTRKELLERLRGMKQE